MGERLGKFLFADVQAADRLMNPGATVGSGSLQIDPVEDLASLDRGSRLLFVLNWYWLLWAFAVDAPTTTTIRVSSAEAARHGRCSLLRVSPALIIVRPTSLVRIEGGPKGPRSRPRLAP
jgi:hypothetical protein